MARESKKTSVRVVGKYLGQDIDRVYSKEEQGKDFEKLAEEFAKKIGGQVKTIEDNKEENEEKEEETE